ncbi:GNAT family N-acetyltransferase [Ornithinimicrobium sediminis]|uniref:GNAT family N-acetyltransferase n=1 Tax=Ornithinimicrobium sediminis TaxID=2904603 RepID=UPI001E387FA5|nr:GNAT family N-acetyltransferase [Ornithinimicrobium sediminis]MCE0486122.1 GNAT family N-acetyltransferase [Ornithinimicrobium sediminis]
MSSQTTPGPGSGHRLVPLTPQDAPRMTRLAETAFFEIAPGITPEQMVATFAYHRSSGVETDEPAPVGVPADAPRPLVGLYCAYDMHVTVPGPGAGHAQVPMSGLSWVSVHPDHRRRGILRSMMAHHLHGLHDDGGAPVAGLWAAEVGIYGRFGYGTASHNMKLELGRGTALQAPPAVVEAAAGLRSHMVPVDSEEATAALQRVHTAAAEHQLGAVTRGEDVRRDWFRDLPKARGPKEPLHVLFVTRDGEATAYATMRRESDWNDYEMPQGKVRVGELGATDSAGLYALVRRLVDFDLTGSVSLPARGVDDPVLWWAGGPRSTSAKVTDALWLRLVDVDRALSRRGYAAPVDVVLEVADDTCPWNARRWRLTAGNDGVGTCVATEDPADLRLPVEVLGAAYAGGRSVAAQAAAGWVTEETPGAVVRLSRAMRGDHEPLGTIGF